MSEEQLPATGERYLPDSMDGEIVLEHLHRYHAALELINGLDVLDIASGEGYGSSLLAGSARSVFGVDISPEAVLFANAKYIRPNLRFVQGTCAAIPLPDASVDAVLSFETIEHHAEHERMFEEFKRILRPGGFIVISSPDRHEYSDVPGYSNPYHVKELYRADFESLLGRWFNAFQLYGQRVRQASTMFAIRPGTPPTRERVANYVLDGSQVQSASDAFAARYFVAVASDVNPLPELPVGVFASSEDNLHKQEMQFATLRGSADLLKEQLEAERNQVEARTVEIVGLRGEMDQWRQHASNLEVRIEGQDNAIRQVAARNAQLVKEAHDHAVALIAEQAVRGAGDALQHRAVNGDQPGVSSKILDSTGAHAVLFHIELGQRKAQLVLLQAELAESKERLSALQLDSDRRQAELVDCKERLSALQLDSDRRQAELVDCKERLSALQSDSHRRQAELVECKERLSALQLDSGKRQAELVECKERISAMHLESGQQAELNGDALRRRDEHIAQLLGSSSWRLMAPLRAARRIVSRVIVKIVRGTGTGTGTGTAYAVTQTSENPSVDSVSSAIDAALPIDAASAIGAALTTEAGRTEATAPIETPDFDAAYYLKLYPDVGRAQLDPYQHYLDHGKAEGRCGMPVPLLLRENNATLRPEKDYILVVSHEATRTGAPILAWNICAELRHQYNVVVMLLGDGDIVEYFDMAADVIVGPYKTGGRETLAITPAIEALCKRYPLRLAIVNSLASRAVLRPLAESFVPSVFLIHEFFKFFCSPDQLVDAMAWAGSTVFSASMVRDSASIERTRPAANASPIIPQGKSVIPAQPRSSDQSGKPNVLSTLIGRRKTKPFIVLGAGTVEYRKGVDLFIATATEIKRRDPEADILMVWIGRVVDIYKDYAEFISEQVEQSGLKDRFELVGPTPDLEEIYRLVDMCFISSRLDPLPNIAIDAMAAGLPVLCFEHASGVAENLIDDPLASSCVLPFLNVEEAARRIVTLYREPNTHAILSERMKSVAQTRFDMKRYVERLVDLGGMVSQAVSQEHLDIEALEQGDQFIEAFYLPPESLRTREDAIREYVKSSQGRIYGRKAAPGFYPHVYAEHHDLTTRQINPFVHFLHAGQPEGPWQERVIDVSRPLQVVLPEALRVALHIHAFYPELLADMVERLESNDVSCDLYVSVPSDEIAREVRARLGTYTSGTYDVRIVPNRGRDIGPLVAEFADNLMAYDVVGHFHTKKSVHVVGSNLVQDWVNFLMQNLLGMKHRPVRNILAEFAADPNLGMVFADDPNMIGWDKNLAFGEHLAARMGIETLPSQFFSFAVGTMFWARPNALKPLFDLHLDWDEFPEEPLPIDGSMLHAIERMLPTIARHAGFGIKVTYSPDVSR